MTEIKFIQGIWWLPEEYPVKKVAGTLTIDVKSEMALDTIGTLGNLSPYDYLTDKIMQFSVIWGIASDSKPVSIFSCIGDITLNTACPFATCHYKTSVVAVGKHISSWDELGNYDVQVKIDELPYWFRPNVIKCLKDNNRLTLSVDPEKANSTSVKLDETCELVLEGVANIKNDNFGLQHVIEETTLLRFIFSDNISPQDAKRRVFAFEQFMSFAALSKIESNTFALIDKDVQLHQQGSNQIVIYDHKSLNGKISNRFSEYLFNYNTIKESFPDVIRKWYAEDKLVPVRAHLIDSINHKGVFTPNDFLIVIQAIEGYYFRFVKPKNELSSLLNELREEFQDIDILELTDQDIKFIRDSRHYYSHLLPEGKKKFVAYYRDLYNLNHKLRKLLLCCILRLVGFDNSKINTICAKSDNSFLRMLNGKVRLKIEEEPKELKGKIHSITEISESEPE